MITTLPRKALLIASSLGAWQLVHAQEWQVFTMQTAGFPSPTVLALAEDTEGRIWAGTDWGLCIQEEGSDWTVWQTQNSGLPENYISALASDPDGAMWIGTLQSGLLRYQNDQWEQWTEQNSPLPDPQINDIDVDDMGRVWIATPAGLVMKDGEDWRVYNDSPDSYGGNILFGRHVARVTVSPNGVVAATSMNGGYTCFTEDEFICYTSYEHEFPDNSGYGVAFDGIGDRWVATTTAGLVRHAGGILDGLWFPYTEANSPIPDNTVRAIAIDADDRKVLGMELNGLAFLDADGQWSFLNSSNSGLPDDQVRELLIASDGSIWVGTWQGGLARYAPSVGVHEHTASLDVRVHPNPFTDQVHITGPDRYGLREWSVYDSAGRLLHRAVFAGLGDGPLVLPELASGTYLLLLIGDRGHIMIPMIRE